MPYRVLDVEAMTQAAAPDARTTSQGRVLESALTSLEKEGWELVTVETTPEAGPRWYFRMNPDRIAGRMNNMR